MSFRSRCNRGRCWGWWGRTGRGRRRRCGVWRGLFGRRGGVCGFVESIWFRIRFRRRRRSHLLHLLEEVCSHVLILKGGQKVADGTVVEIKQKFSETGENNLENAFFQATAETRVPPIVPPVITP